MSKTKSNTNIKAARKGCAPYEAKLLECRVCLGLPVGSNAKCLQDIRLSDELSDDLSVSNTNEIVSSSLSSEIVPSTPPADLVIANLAPMDLDNGFCFWHGIDILK
jgi:hypothetical protein